MAIESHFSRHRVYGNQNDLMSITFIFTMGNFIWVLTSANIGLCLHLDGRIVS
jgi:hypothetical protein